MRWKNIAIYAAAAVVFPAVTNANFITNGNFESSTTTPFPNWNANPSGVAAVAPKALDGNTSAETLGATAGDLSQSFGAIASTTPFVLSFEFAATDPGSGNRVANVILSGTSGQINFRVIDGATSGFGTAQIYDGSNWQPVSADSAITFSSSLNTPSIQTISIQGTVGGAYTVTTDGTSKGPYSYYQGGAAANFSNINLDTNNGTNGNTVYDDFVLTPEPSAIALLGAAGAGLLLRRRSKGKSMR